MVLEESEEADVRLLLITILALVTGLPRGASWQPAATAPAVSTGEIRDRLEDLIAASDAAQFKTPASLPHDRSFTVGMYPARVDFLIGPPDRPLRLLDDVLDASGSSLIGLWFLSQSHRILGSIDRIEVMPLRDALLDQIERARDLPRFFQGTTEDVLGCPVESMGWYPLVDGYRLPSLLPDWLVDLLPAYLLGNLANMSDGDIWAWCLAIEDTTPGILRYHHAIDSIDAFAPLLGSRIDPDALDPDARSLYLEVRGGEAETRYPIGTFYGTSVQKKQRFSTVVMANILASIPLLDRVRPEYREEIDDAAAFVRDATWMALQGDLDWKDFAYDYYTIPVAPIAYVVRAHKRIEEIGRGGYPGLLDRATIDAAADFISDEAGRILANPHLHEPRGARDYASLVYCFDAMMNLRYLDPDLLDQDLVDATARALLTPNPASRRVPGTGPYRVLGPISADMASICFVVPPLIEAYALYWQQIECRESRSGPACRGRPPRGGGS